ncbi:modulator of drug activity B [Philodulcilactobacillus myokoensis]|uniref:Modulator of drug activity B n=1 Tax=Philodulcilactobacillus myokoensis TaxID=2929573 RepID=A0A9W6ETC6_9LACO|nr:NAD(P)H-dependent oxidoreductase [Philodulcilactobacillus myokoensis]GLB47287.1 modulator of drug activity B [Philodulcilactobacillus myokoensis]
MKVLLINGYETHKDSNGKLNLSLYSLILSNLRKKGFDVRLSSVEDYDRYQEINKFLWADVIIFQFPIYWFNIPGELKQYLDQVFAFRILYNSSLKYGQGGLLKGKKYMLSSTWNAPSYAFNDKKEFFEGLNPDDVLRPMHFAMKYVGMKPLADHSVSFHDVVFNTDFPKYQKDLESYLDKYLPKQK